MPPLLAVLLSLALVLSPPALAEAAGKGKGKNKGEADDVAAENVVGAVIRAVEKSTIEDYIRRVGGSGQGLPPGLAKREHLPPGLAKQIRVNGTLPPGLAKRDLPRDLLALLPDRPPGQKFAVVGDDIVLVETATNLILDVLKGVLRGK